MEEDEALQLHCIEDRELFVGRIGGVYHYQHGDRSSCKPYNSFCTPVEDILGIIGLHENKPGVAPSAALRAAYIMSFPLRLKFFQTCEDSSGANLRLLLEKMVGMMDNAWNEKILCWELGEAFGDVVWLNLGMIEPKRQFVSMRQVPDPLYELPTFEMENLRDARLSSAIYNVVKTVADARKFGYRGRKST